MKLYSHQAGFRKPVRTRRYTLVEIISALFILTFLYTALSKTMDISSTVNTLTVNPLFRGHAFITAWMVIGAEYLTAVLLFIPATRSTGLYCSLFLMAAFTGFIIYMLLATPKLPCSCGGIISKLTWKQHLVLNILLTIMAGTGIRLGKAPPERHARMAATAVTSK